MAKSRNASPSLNGFDFQIDVALYLMIKFIGEFDKIRVEGLKEDIELELENKQKIMVQVKSQWNNFENKNNVISNLESSLRSLAEADADDVRDLMYVSNLPDPLKNNDLEYTSYHGITTKKYSELSEQSKLVVENKLVKIFGSNNNFNKEKLWIIRIPFYGQDDDEKHKFIYELIKEFLMDISEKISCKNFVFFWEAKFLHNGSDNPKILITKKDLSNNLILTCLESYDDSLDYTSLNTNEDDFDEAYEKYREFIEEKQDCYEAICKVNSLYERTIKRNNISKEKFIQLERIKLYNYFFEDNKIKIEEFSQKEIMDMLVAQIISYVILKKRHIIKQINEKVLK